MPQDEDNATRNHDNELIVESLTKLDPHILVPISISPLVGGQSQARLYKVYFGTHRAALVARIMTDSLQLNKELVITKITGDASLGPKLIYPKEILKTNQILICEFVEGGALIPSELDKYKSQLLSKIKTMHQLDTANIHLAKSLQQRVHALLEQMQPKLSPDWFDFLLKQLRAIASLSKQIEPDKRCFTHNDLNAGNIKVNLSGDIKIFDWGTAGIGNPLADLADFSNHYGYPFHQSLDLLKDYKDAKSPSMKEQDYFIIMKSLSILRLALLGLSIFSKLHNKKQALAPELSNTMDFFAWFEGYKKDKYLLATADDWRLLSNCAFQTWLQQIDGIL